MTKIEQKALALAIEAREDDKMRLCPDSTLTFSNWEALCRAIEQHEAFKQEVGFALSNEWHNLHYGAKRNLDRFRIPLPKPDPLVETLKNMDAVMERLEAFRAALEALEIEIREKSND